MNKFSGLIIGATIAGAAGVAMADSTSFDQTGAEPRGGQVYDNYAGYAPDEASFPVTTDAPGVETVNRGGQAETAWQSNDGAWMNDAATGTVGPEKEVIIGDPDVAQVFGRG